MAGKLWIAVRGSMLIGLALGAALFARMAEEQSVVVVSLTQVYVGIEPSMPAHGTGASSVYLGSISDAGSLALQYSQWSFYCGLGCATLGGVELIARFRRGQPTAK